MKNISKRKLQKINDIFSNILKENEALKICEFSLYDIVHKCVIDNRSIDYIKKQCIKHYNDFMKYNFI